MPSFAKLVAGGQDENRRQHRVVALGTKRIIEGCDRDSLGGPRWSKLGEIDLADTTPGALSGKAASALLHIIDDLAAARAALSKTFDYSTGEGCDADT